MSSLPSSLKNSEPQDRNSNPNHKNAQIPISDSPRTPSIVKLRKIPPIPFRHRAETSEDGDEDEGSDAECHHEEGVEEEEEDEDSIIRASTLGLNPIRTRSLPSPLRFSSSSGAPSKLKKDKVESHPKSDASHQTTTSSELGKKVQWSQSKSLRGLPSPLNPGLEGNHAAFAKEIQSPRVQAILRVTSGRKKRAPEIKSFSHELNSKGVRALPFWKSRAFGQMEEIMVMVRAKFDKLKDEVNSDLGIYAGDLVSILENNSELCLEWKESLEDLLVIARQCAKMSPNEFWLKCEGIVQTLDDRRQELPMGTLKQAHTRLLFILTRCTRLLQFQKENGYEEDHILASHQLSDLGVYPERILGVANQDFNSSLGGKEMSEGQNQKPHGWDQSNLGFKQDQVKQNLGGVVDGVEVSTAKSVTSSTGSYRMSSWKKLPSAAEKNRKGPDSVDSTYKDKSNSLQHKDENTGIEVNVETLDTPVCHPEHAETNLKVRKVTWGVFGDQQNVTYENSFICRICEVEIPTVYVEEHSKICTIADRCDLKGLTVNERLDRVAEALETILESWTPKGTDTAVGSPDSAKALPEELDELSPRQNSLSHGCSIDMLDCVHEADTAFLVDDLDNLPDMSCETRGLFTPDLGKKGSSAGSMTPRSPLLTPRMNQIELLLSGRKTISEHENYQQVCD
ncbi:unnamed protein product [Ilex paraguariensis]|uniref:IREH1/IRE-like N-terminal domain-containing protein n=1 Tax=Ilex paraguariensis TaxID=185542 RepID=A0ABC8QR68_9AQUA